MPGIKSQVRGLIEGQIGCNADISGRLYSLYLVHNAFERSGVKHLNLAGESFVNLMHTSARKLRLTPQGHLSGFCFAKETHRTRKSDATCWMGHELGKFIGDWAFEYIRGHWVEKIGRRLLLCRLLTAWKPPRMVAGNEEQGEG